MIKLGRISSSIMLVICAMSFYFSFTTSYAAPVTINISQSEWKDGDTGNFAAFGYGSSEGGMPGATTNSGWLLDYTSSTATTFSPGAWAPIIVPDCASGDIEINFSFTYDAQITPYAQIAGFIGDVSVPSNIDGGTSPIMNSPQSATISAHAVITKAQYDAGEYVVYIGTDQVNGAKILFSNVTTSVNYDDSACNITTTTSSSSTTTTSTSTTTSSTSSSSTTTTTVPTVPTTQLVQTTTQNSVSVGGINEFRKAANANGTLARTGRESNVNVVLMLLAGGGLLIFLSQLFGREKDILTS